jgi:SAM-dependent methyltransferase
VSEFSIRPSDEPFDFRRQAATYGKFRRDYSPALYDAIGSRTGVPAARLAIDLGCGPGIVTSELVRRGWRAIGADFSTPMLSEAHAAHPAIPFLRTRGEAMGLRAGAVALVTCGTAFHWIPPVAGMAELGRVLAPGGVAALFWRYAIAGQPHMEAISEALREVGVTLPDAYSELRVHASEPFAGTVFVDAAEIRIPTALDFTAESFHGWVSTIEFMRRLAADRHAEFLDRLGERLTRSFPTIREENEEYLFLARRP